MFSLIFFTTSRIKNNHATYLCREYDIDVINFHQKTYHASYVEPRINDREELLKASYMSALSQLKKRRLADNYAFIIEDTSVDIVALRNGEEENPGLDIKYWMAETTLEDVDLQILFSGGDRTVYVRSDVVLYLPDSDKEPIFFNGISKGTVVEEEKSFETNPIYPWLDNKTFNKWFQPEGEKLCISLLPIERSNKYDFRKKAFDKLLSYLESQGYIQKKEKDQGSKYFTDRLFDGSCYRCDVVVGFSCSGKTTIAEFLADKHGFLQIEASDFIHQAFYEAHGVISEVSIGKYAQEKLKVEPLLVVKRVLKFLKSCHWPRVIVTGFRLGEEVDYFVQNYKDIADVNVVYIDTDLDLRVERRARRNRDSEGASKESLMERDQREREMGLGDISLRDDKVLIKNNGDFIAYYRNYLKLLPIGDFKTSDGFNLLKGIGSVRLSELVLVALYVNRMGAEGSEKNYLTTTEVCKEINRIFKLDKPKYKDNVSRHFNQRYSPLYEVKVFNKKRKYRISNTGAGLARILYKELAEIILE